MENLLRGCAILIIRPAGLGDALANMVRQAGGEALLLPTIDILPAPRPARLAMLIARLHSFDWAIFVSPTAAREGIRSVRTRRRWPPGVRIAAVGRGTAEALEEMGIGDSLYPDAPGDSEALAAMPELQDIVGQNVAIFRGDGGRETLGRMLAGRGARVEYAECYRRARPALDMTELRARCQDGALQAICAASGEALRNLLDMTGAVDAPRLRETPVFVPHPRVAETACDLGFSRAIVAIGGDNATATALAAFFAKV